VLAYVQAGTIEFEWTDALMWAVEEGLPLILVCADATGGTGKAGRPKENKLSWMGVDKLARKALLPTLAVDGEDAVAVYRCMQESVIRARGGGGPAIIWAVMSGAKKVVPRSRQPLGRLESYLKVRNIQVPKRS
jgi:TPP-dependent pyruvate/acetoin dehydrogenase alpha subunit